MANTITHTLLADEARRRGWQTRFYGKEEMFLEVTDEQGRFDIFRGSRPNASSANGVVVTGDKDATLQFVRELGYDVPDFLMTDSLAEVSEFLDIHKKIVVKPIDSDKSNGVTVNITSREQAAQAMQYARQHSSSREVIVQKQITGKLYRIFVLDGNAIVVTERQAAQVVGDGQRTIQELVDLMNMQPGRGVGGEHALQRVDPIAVREYLGESKLLDVPSPGMAVRVSPIESVSAGGMAINVTEYAHRSWLEMAVSITERLGLFVSGFDIMTDDIQKPMENVYVPLLEINSRPGLKIHEYPFAGEPVHIAPMLLDAVFAHKRSRQ